MRRINLILTEREYMKFKKAKLKDEKGKRLGWTKFFLKVLAKSEGRVTNGKPRKD